MNKITVIHQPDFLPYLGFFHRLLHADLFVILDDVQFLRQGWHHRDKIKTPNGEQWLTLEIKKAPQCTNINEILLFGNNWRKSHLEQLKRNYKKSKYFNEIFIYIEELYNGSYEKMIDINMASIQMLLKLFDINIKLDFSSNYDFHTKSNERLVDILKKVGATHYLSGIGAKDYLKDEFFKTSKIELLWQEFKHPTYNQLYDKKFIPYLSSIDLLFNCGIENSRKILRGI